MVIRPSSDKHLTSSELKEIFIKVRQDGGNAFLVGECVRDLLMEVDSKDVEVEVYGMSPKRLIDILSKFGTVEIVGHGVGSFNLMNVKFSFPRRVSNPDKIDPYLMPSKSCLTRDFTVNAMMYDLLGNQVMDFFGGKEDLKKKTLRYINADAQSFFGDPALILRGARLMSELGFAMHPDTTSTCMKNVASVKGVPRAIVFNELVKLLMSPKPSSGFLWMMFVGVHEQIFPEIHNLLHVMEDERYHPEMTTFNHTMLALDVLDQKEKTPEIMLGVLCHDFGKAECWDFGMHDGKYPGHSTRGVGIARKFMERLTSDSEIINKVCDLVRYHMSGYYLKNLTLSKKWITVWSKKIDINSFLKVHKADVKGRAGRMCEDLTYIAKAFEHYYNITEEVKPIIMGRHLIKLGMVPSPAFKPILDKLYDLQMEGRFTTEAAGEELVRKVINGELEGKQLLLEHITNATPNSKDEEVKGLA